MQLTKAGLVSIVLSVAALGLDGCANNPSATSPGAAAGANSKASAAKQVTAKDVIARYKKAIYGGDGTRKHSSTTMKGNLSIEQYGIEGPFMTYAMAPDSNVTVMELMGAKLSTGCHKGTCWAQQPGGGTQTLSGDAAALQLQQSDYNQWDHADRYYTSLEIIEPPAGAESANYKIRAVKKNGDKDFYEFSKETGYMTSAVIEGETAQGRMTVELQFKNYKDFDGVKTPTEVIETVPQGTLKLTFSEVTYTPIAEDKFAKPN